MRWVTMAPAAVITLAVVAWMAPFVFVVVWTGVIPLYAVALWAYAALVHVLWWRGLTVVLGRDTLGRKLLSGATMVALATSVLGSASMGSYFSPAMMLTNFLVIAQLVVATVDLTQAERLNGRQPNVLLNLLLLSYLAIGVWFLRPRLNALAAR